MAAYEMSFRARRWRFEKVVDKCMPDSLPSELRCLFTRRSLRDISGWFQAGFGLARASGCGIAGTAVDSTIWLSAKL